MAFPIIFAEERGSFFDSSTCIWPSKSKLIYEDNVSWTEQSYKPPLHGTFFQCSASVSFFLPRHPFPSSPLPLAPAFDSCTCLGNHLIILKWTKQKRWWVCWSLLHSVKGMGIYKKTSHHQKKEPFLDPLQSPHVKMCLCVCHCFATALKYKVTGFYEIWIRILLNNKKKSLSQNLLRPIFLSLFIQQTFFECPQSIKHHDRCCKDWGFLNHIYSAFRKLTVSCTDEYKYDEECDKGTLKA